MILHSFGLLPLLVFHVAVNCWVMFFIESSGYCCLRKEYFVCFYKVNRSLCGPLDLSQGFKQKYLLAFNLSFYAATVNCYISWFPYAGGCHSEMWRTDDC